MILTNVPKREFRQKCTRHLVMFDKGQFGGRTHGMIGKWQHDRVSHRDSRDDATTSRTRTHAHTQARS